jgi:glucose-6-phosphate isomerase/transaldolase/glucose-6-phosphate isomerase
VFVNPSDIGGRYSALSYFGLVPAAVAGVDIRRLLGRGVAEAARSKEQGSDALTLGAALGELTLAGRDKCTLILSPGIAAFGLWAEQLIAESTGKEGRGILPVDGEPLGSPAHYGDDRFFVYLRLQADNSGHTDATVGALQAEGFPVITIELDDVYDLGREFFRWEFAVAVAGHILGINPFDEPNVKESKDNTSRVLRDFESTGRFDDHPSTGPLTAIRTLAATLAPPAYLAITAYVLPTNELAGALHDVRSKLRDSRRTATTLGFGPRFLHSTGQLHKGGPSQGSFLQITADEAEDLPIPGRPYTFGQLKRAQAIGDFESLAAHGRPVVRVHLGSAVRESDRQLAALLIAAAALHDEKG